MKVSYHQAIKDEEQCFRDFFTCYSIFWWKVELDMQYHLLHREAQIVGDQITLLETLDRHFQGTEDEGCAALDPFNL